MVSRPAVRPAGGPVIADDSRVEVLRGRVDAERAAAGSMMTILRATGGWCILRRMPGRKDGWHGCRMVVAGRLCPSSRTCFACGAVKAALALSESASTGVRHVAL